MVLGAAATTAATDPTAGRGQGSGPLQGTAGLREGQAGWWWGRVVVMVMEVVGVSVTVLGALLLGGRGLQAAGVGVTQGQVSWRGSAAR